MDYLQKTTKGDLALIIYHPYVELGPERIRLLQLVLQLFSHSFDLDYRLRDPIMEKALYHDGNLLVMLYLDGLVFLCDSDRNCLCKCINCWCNPKTEINPGLLFCVSFILLWVIYRLLFKCVIVEKVRVKNITVHWPTSAIRVGCTQRLTGQKLNGASGESEIYASW